MGVITARRHDLNGGGPKMRVVAGNFELGEIARKAYLDLSTPGTLLDTIVEAHAPGVAGNDITIASAADGGLATAELDMSGVTTNVDSVLDAHSAGYAGNDITIALTGDAVAAKAELDCGLYADNALDTVLETHAIGADGNDYEIILAGDSPGAAGVTIDIDFVNTIMTVHFETTVSTVGDVEAAITALAGAENVIDVKTPGTGATVLVNADDAFGPVSMTGGADQETISVVGTAIAVSFEDGVTTVTELETLIGALSGADDILDVKTGGTGGNVLTATDDNLVATNLAGGEDAARISRSSTAFTIHYTDGVTDVDAVETLIAALSGADDLFGVKTGGTGANVLVDPDDTFVATSLANGVVIDTPDKTGALEVQSITHTSTGLYTLIMRDSFPDMLSAVATLQLATAAKYACQVKSWVASTKTLIIEILDLGTGAVADPVVAVGDKVNFIVTFSETTRTRLS